jgi:hypothetical protein
MKSSSSSIVTRNRRGVTVILALALSVAATMLALAAPATAEPATGKPVLTTEAISTAAAWDCPSGNFCIWENTNGTGRRCMWSDADPDWWSGNIICSWADDTPVESFLNNGTSTRFTGVQVYRGANYQVAVYGCIPRGRPLNILGGGVVLRSHRWVTYTCL